MEQERGAFKVKSAAVASAVKELAGIGWLERGSTPARTSNGSNFVQLI